MLRIFKTVSDLVKEDIEGNSKVVKKDIITKCQINVDDIICHGEIYNDRGKVLKSMIRIHVKDVGNFIVKEKFDIIESLRNEVDKRTKIKGYK